MNQTPLVSVVVLVYNTGDYLLPAWKASPPRATAIWRC